jgi:hypothetical protein
MNDIQHIAIVRRDAAQMRVVSLRNKLFEAEFELSAAEKELSVAVSHDPNAWAATT